MKFIWEASDFKPGSDKWGLMARDGDELVIIGGMRCTSLRDGHSWEYESTKKMADEFNKHGYVPVLAPINPSVVIKAAAEKQFNFGAGL